VFDFLLRAEPCKAGIGCERPDTLKSYAVSLQYRSIEWASEDADVSPALDNLRRLEEDPLDIATASASELQQIPGVRAQAAHQIVSYRNHHSLEHSEDLRAIKGIDSEVAEALELFVKFPRSSMPSLTLRTRIVRKLMDSSPSGGQVYGGSPEKIYNRLAGRFNLSQDFGMSGENPGGVKGASLSFGILTAKDPGERSLTDLMRGQVVATLPVCSSRVVLGDFMFDGGQEIVFWRPNGFSKGGEATAGVTRNGAGVWPSLSTGQSMTFRGIGINIQPPRVGLHLFYSNKSMDATVDSAGVVTHVGSDDLHRTETELARRDVLKELAFGGRVTVDIGLGFRIGLSGFTSRFSKRIQQSGPFGFEGISSSAIGVDCLYVDGSVSVFAEVAQDRAKAGAAIAGMSALVRSDLTLAFLVRSFSKTYNNFHSSGFSESGNGCRNETGFYAGLTFRPTAGIRLEAFVDQFTFPWRTYGSIMTSQGHEYCLGIDYRMRDNVGIELQLRQKDKAESNKLDGDFDSDQLSGESRGRTTYRGKLHFEPAGSFRWQSCIELVTVGLEHGSVQERGVLFFQDLSADLGRQLTLSARAVAFHTDSYESRVYEYETDMPGAYSSPALFERGFRWYVLCRYRWAQRSELSAKYSLTTMNNVNLGGESDSQISFQLDLAL
jgi:hypothetical protein